MKLCITAIIGLLLMGGCSRQNELVSGRMEQGLVVVLPGIEGHSPLNREICVGLAEGGVQNAIELYDWTSAFTFILTPVYNQRAYNRNHDKAAEIARMIARYKVAYPNNPVVLVGQSGGGAMAIWTVEALPPGVQVDGVILLAASISTNYPLDTALSKTKRGIINFYSNRDWFFLGLGTTAVGTMDGEHSSSAGKNGFEEPKHWGRPNTYNKLFQIPWQSRMSGGGAIGIHLTSGAPQFVANYVAPFVRLPRWNDDVIERVLRNEHVESIMKSAGMPAVKLPATAASRVAPASATATSPPVGDVPAPANRAKPPEPADAFEEK
jgi:pimeloyl-ACP methyl ester carboxylesterase